MAASFAPPAIALENGGHNHGHGYGHGQSQNRKSSIKRIPLQLTSTNGGLQVNGDAQPNPLKPRTHPRPLAVAPSVDLEATSHDQSESNPPSGSPHLPVINSNNRPKGMERRRSSVGLPTHLRLGSSGYGFPPASSQKYESASGRVIRKWATRTEAASAVIVPLPYILASLAFRGFNLPPSILQHPIVSRLGASFLKVVFNGKVKRMTVNDTLLSACCLTSMTLILVGLRGKIGGIPKVLDRRKHSSSKSNLENNLGARKIFERMISVGLPYLATMKLGGDRVALIMLLALHADITHAEDEITDLLSIKGWKRLLAHRRWTLVSILLQMCCDLIGLTNYSSVWNTCFGYLALAVSILYISPPFPSLKSKGSTTTSFSSISASPTPQVLATQWETRNSAKPVSDALVVTSPLICTKRDTNLTIAAGSALGALTCIISFFSRENVGVSSVVEVGFGFLSACAAAISFQWVQPHSLRQNSGLGLLFGSLTYLVLLAIPRSDTWESIAYQGAFIGISFAATKLDSHLTLTTSHSKNLDHHHPHRLHQYAKHEGMPSRFSEFLLRSFRNWPLLHSILAEKDSRRIFYFMSLNFAFMLIQLFYGIATGSLGLLSDSIHMFFDCLALVVGLCAAVMSKWPPSTRFPYGYGKMDTLAGFANGIFLMLISIEIVYEAIERLAEGSEMQRIGELLTVSSLGLVVNLIGITAFGHAHHGHSHGGHDHSHGGHDHSHEGHDHSHGDHDHSHGGHDHSHGGHDHSGHSDYAHPNHTHDSLRSHHDHHHHDCDSHSHLHDHLDGHSTPNPYPSMPAVAVKSNPTQAHTHSHKHHHGNENMHGIFLHILADTLGSVAVVISTLLIHFYGWSGFDPLASCLIAILIFASAIPLVTSSARTLLLTIPENTEFDLREALAGVSGLRGVVGYAVPKFWLNEGDDRKVLGVIHVIASKGADMEDVKERAVAFLRGRQMEVLVQVERDGSDRCWCRGGTKA